ncbi:MAG: bifunctional aspartate transaminase/aspartate 4-decarboxylase [bacterium]|nr:bifunctional aspartate transaminase/aspartate 4-decarboxylase [bacterium]
MLAAIPGIKVAGEKKAQGLSPFELKNALIDYAKKSPKYEQVLNAGRGNPNFYNAPARLALCKLTEFAISISQPYKENKAVRFAPTAPTTKKEKDELYESFKKQFKNDHSEGASFLVEAVDWAIEHLELDRGEFLYEITDAARGDFYPGAPAQNTPPRILANTQKIVEKYLEQILLSKSKSKGSFDLFATEGATAGMVYVFNSLMENFILQKKDKVAVITPVFSPYLEIPALNDYEFDLVFINATQKKEWQIPKKEIEKLKDPHIKALYLINPTNPTSMALSQETLNEIHDVLQENKDLIILVDAVYSTFVDDFRPIIDLAPYNCITMYSFSKYFGVTGWRLGVVMLNGKNIINDKIASVINNNSRKKEALRMITTTGPSAFRWPTWIRRRIQSWAGT